MELPLVEHPPPYLHAFCGMCGSPSPFMHAAKGGMSVPTGSLDDDPAAESAIHIYAEHEAPWLAQIESAPRLTSAQIRELRRSRHA